jgi:hypothetical protein
MRPGDFGAIKFFEIRVMPVSLMGSRICAEIVARSRGNYNRINNLQRLIFDFYFAISLHWQQRRRALGIGNTAARRLQKADS